MPTRLRVTVPGEMPRRKAEQRSKAMLFARHSSRAIAHNTIRRTGRIRPQPDMWQRNLDWRRCLWLAARWATDTGECPIFPRTIPSLPAPSEPGPPPDPSWCPGKPFQRIRRSNRDWSAIAHSRSCTAPKIRSASPRPGATRRSVEGGICWGRWFLASADESTT